MDNRPIGVFDSGIGGLTVVDALAKSMPLESILYVGDTARVPYGNKSKERIQQYACEITDWLIKQDCKLIVVACNTVSSLALKKIQEKFNIPIIGVIHPGVMAAIKVTKNNRVGVLGTIATIKSDSYGIALREQIPGIEVVGRACPLFVPLVEEGWVNGPIPENIALAYFDSIKESRIDTVILGCTHYPLLNSTIKKVLGETVSLVDSGVATADIVISVLNDLKLFSNAKSRSIKSFVTDSIDVFETLAKRFVDAPINSIEHIDIT
jgi:glutamate racemase